MKLTASFCVLMIFGALHAMAQEEDDQNPPELQPVPTTDFDPLLRNEMVIKAILAEVVAKLQSGPPPIKIGDKIYPSYCTAKEDSNHIYVVVPYTDCHTFFQRHPGNKQTEQQSCAANQVFDIEICGCVQKVLDPEECDDIPSGNQTPIDVEELFKTVIGSEN